MGHCVYCCVLTEKYHGEVACQEDAEEAREVADGAWKTAIVSLEPDGRDLNGKVQQKRKSQRYQDLPNVEKVKIEID